MKDSAATDRLSELEQEYRRFREADIGKAYVKEKLADKEQDIHKYLEPWYKFSRKSDFVYPSQGLLETPYDYLESHSTQMLPQDTIIETLRLRHYFLELFNHPFRIHYLNQTDKEDFHAPPRVSCRVLESAINSGLTLSINDLGASVTGSEHRRISRTERYGQGPFIKLGRQARTIIAGSASPDVWNSAAAVATMAAAHTLAIIPRNGLLSSVIRQADFAEEVFSWLEVMEKDILAGREDRDQVASYWKRNVCAAIESNPQKVMQRVKALYEKGVKSFRIYSPEPGTGPVDTLKLLRDEYGDKIEIFVGQVVDNRQAMELEREGADGLYVGIGGGGRCITGVRSGSVVDWPELVWEMRGNVKIPIIAEGGASDHIAVSLLLGASAIATSRIVSGGTIESPGGLLYYADKQGRLFKPYGGEASARTKFLDGKLLPFNVPSFVEGETRKAKMNYIQFALPTLTYNLHLILEDAILALVFRGAKSVEELHRINPSPLRRVTAAGEFSRGTH